jgi:hypothetical protein
MIIVRRIKRLSMINLTSFFDKFLNNLKIFLINVYRRRVNASVSIYARRKQVVCIQVFKQ